MSNLGRKSFFGYMVFSLLVWSFGMNVLPTRAAELEDGDLIKASGAAVYYYDADEDERWVFPNEKTFKTWFSDFSKVKKVTDAELAAIPIGGNIVYRSGGRLVKITTDPKVYAVQPSGELCWVMTEEVAIELWGKDWSKWVDDVPDAFFAGNYEVNEDCAIEEAMHPAGSLIKYKGESDVFLVADVDGEKVKRLVASGDAFAANMFMDKYVVQTDIVYEDGDDITGAEDELLDVSQAATDAGDDGADGDDGDGVVSGGDLMVSLASDSPVSTSVVSDTSSSTDGAQALANFAKLDFKSGSADVKVTQLKFKRMGIATDNILSNAYLYDKNGNRLADLTSFSGGVLTFSNSAGLFTVKKGEPYPLWVKADIGNNQSAGQTVGLSLLAVSDITTDGVAIKGTFPINGSLMTTAAVTDLGRLTIGATPSPTAATTVDAGQKEYEVFRFVLTGNDQEIDLHKVVVTNIGSIDDDDLQNFMLFDGGKQIGAKAVTLTNRVVSFDLSEAPLKFTVGQTKTFSLRADIVAGSNKTYRFSIQNQPDLVAKDRNYGIFLKPGGTNTFTIVQAGGVTTINTGSLTVTVAKDSPSGNKARGETNMLLAKYELKANGEDIRLTDVVVQGRLGVEDDCPANGTNDSASTGGLNNGKVFIDGRQVGTTTDLEADVTAEDGLVDSGGALTATNADDDTTFTLGSAVILPVGQTVLMEVRADLLCHDGSALGANETITFAVGGFAGTGKTSSATLQAPTSTQANTITAVAAGVATAVSPGLANATTQNPTGVPNTKAVKVAAFDVSATASEDLEINNIVIGATLNSDNTSRLSTNYQNLKLVDDKGVQLGRLQENLGSANSFTFNVTNYLVKAGQRVTVYALADVLSTAVNAVASCGSSGTTTAPLQILQLTSVSFTAKNTGTSSTESTARAGQLNCLLTSGTLTMALAGNSPKASQLVEDGSTEVTLGIWELTTGKAEDVRVEMVRFNHVETANQGSLANFKLFKGDGTMINSPISATDSNRNVQFNLSGSELVLVKGQTEKIVLKATVRQDPDAVSGSAHTMGIAVTSGTVGTSDMTVRGNSSNVAVTPAVSGANLNSNPQDIYKTRVKVKHGDLEGKVVSGPVSAGSKKEVFKFTVENTANPYGQKAFLNRVGINIDGTQGTATQGITGTSNAFLYNMSDVNSTTAQVEAYKSVATTSDGTTSVAVVADADSSAIPVGANIRFLDNSAFVAGSFLVTRIDDSDGANDSTENATNNITFSPSMATNIFTTATGDALRYIPMNPGTGRLFFGGFARLAPGGGVDTPDIFDGTTSTITVPAAVSGGLAQTSGFAVGDTVRIICHVPSNDADNAGVMMRGNSIIQYITPTTLIMTAAIDLLRDSNGAALVENCDTDFNPVASFRHVGIGGQTGGVSGESSAFVYTTNVNNTFPGIFGFEVSSGTKEAYIVFGDTSGLTNPNTLSFGINAVGAVADLSWDDGLIYDVTADTEGLPLTGGTLTY